MGLFDRIRKSAMKHEPDSAETPVTKQDLSVEEKIGTVFSMHLLFEKPCAMPDKDRVAATLEKHLGAVSCFSYKNDGIAGFAAENYNTVINNKTVSPILNLCCCTNFDPDKQLDIMVTSQMWECDNEQKADILQHCRYQVLATDMLASPGMMNYKSRADMLMNYLDALLELYPNCNAIFFPTGGKIYPADKLRVNNIPNEHRFLYYAVNKRFFNISGTDGDMIVDTIGMSTLGLPDLQYHFRTIDVNEIICHASNMLIYIFENNNPIKNGDTIDSIRDGILTDSIMWKCQYEDSLIQPLRPVIDVNSGVYAAGNRD